MPDVQGYDIIQSKFFFLLPFLWEQVTFVLKRVMAYVINFVPEAITQSPINCVSLRLEDIFYSYREDFF